MEALQSGSAFSRERPRKKANPRVAGGEFIFCLFLYLLIIMSTVGSLGLIFIGIFFIIIKLVLL